MVRTVSRCLRQLRLLKGCIKSLPFESVRAAVAPFVTSQVDRWNNLLVIAPKYLLDCLQSVRNRRKYDHVAPLLRNVLHRLPVPLRIEFKICLLVYKSLHGAAPGYLLDYCKGTHSSASGLRIRSTDKCDLLIRRMMTRFGDRHSQLLASNTGTDFLLICVRPIQSILLKLDSRPTCSAMHIPLLVECEAPL